jgi:hypothetical protein
MLLDVRFRGEPEAFFGIFSIIVERFHVGTTALASGPFRRYPSHARWNLWPVEARYRLIIARFNALTICAMMIAKIG